MTEEQIMALVRKHYREQYDKDHPQIDDIDNEPESNYFSDDIEKEIENLLKGELDG